MKPTTRGDIRKVAQTVAADYISSEQAALSTGFSYPQLYKWCVAHNVRCIKRRGRWMYHREDLAAALRDADTDTRTVT